jgi:WD40 repeat protein
VSGSSDASVKVWGIKNFSNNASTLSVVPIAEFYDHEESIASISINQTGKYLAAGSIDGNLIIWDLETQCSTCKYLCSYNKR